MVEAGCWLIYKYRRYSKRELTPETLTRTPGTPVTLTPSTHSLLHHNAVADIQEDIF